MPWQHVDGLCQHIKCFIFLETVPKNGGCSSCVPGSHLVRHHWSEHPVLRGKTFQGAGNREAGDPQDSMPHHVKFAVPAGTAVLMDTRCCEPSAAAALALPLSLTKRLVPSAGHTAMPNTSQQDRYNVILTYTPRTHRQLGMVEDNKRILDAAGKLTRPSLRKVLGLMDAEAGDQGHYLPSARSAGAAEQRVAAEYVEVV